MIDSMMCGQIPGLSINLSQLTQLKDGKVWGLMRVERKGGDWLENFMG